ncbi:MAG: amino acid--tRNA ligase-related protein [Nanoarchaeota archaeon]
MRLFTHMMQEKDDTIAIQSALLRSLQTFFHEHEFHQLLPLSSPILSPIKGDVKAWDLNNKISQTMMLQHIVSHNHSRVFAITSEACLEKSEQNVSFPCSKLDFEIRDASSDDVMMLIEDMICFTFREIIQNETNVLRSLRRRIQIPITPFTAFHANEARAMLGPEFQRILSERNSQPFWIINNEDPFTRQDKETGHLQNFILLFPEGYGSAIVGGERAWDKDLIMSRLKVSKAFRALSKDDSPQPTAGGTLCLQRMVKFLCGESQHHSIN